MPQTERLREVLTELRMLVSRAKDLAKDVEYLMLEAEKEEEAALAHR